MIEISTRPEYEQAVRLGLNPLIDWRHFAVNIYLRIELQKELFGAADFQKENQKFYRWVWDHKMKNCEETGRPLYNYSSVNISHIITKGSDRRMATDPRNVNLLIYEMHNMWEIGDRLSMNINNENNLIINLLKQDYNAI